MTTSIDSPPPFSCAMQGAQHPWVLNTQCRVRRRLNLAVPEGRARLGMMMIMVVMIMMMMTMRMMETQSKGHKEETPAGVRRAFSAEPYPFTSGEVGWCVRARCDHV